MGDGFQRLIVDAPPAVMSLNVPLRLLRYKRCVDFGVFGVHGLLLISSMSGQPSPSTSRNAQPEPRVSGNHFFPDLPLL